MGTTMMRNFRKEMVKRSMDWEKKEEEKKEKIEERKKEDGRW